MSILMGEDVVTVETVAKDTTRRDYIWSKVNAGGREVSCAVDDNGLEP